MISRLWGRADTAYPSEELNPEDYGWVLVNEVFSPVWFDGNCLPEAFKDLQEPEGEENVQQEPVEEEEQQSLELDEIQRLEDLVQAEWSDASDDEDSDLT